MAKILKLITIIKKHQKNILRILVVFTLMIVLSIFLANQIIEKTTQHQVYNALDSIPPHQVGLLLGTSKWLKNGKHNLYFNYRIIAAADLYQSNKIKFILISGDNSLKNYNEPLDMKLDLIKKGVPEDKIILDYAGFRTLDSVLRAKYIFGQESMVIISQEFHNKRALYIAKHYGINAIAYNAKDVDKRNGLKVQIREKISRVKVFLDILINKQPKYWGEKIEIS